MDCYGETLTGNDTNNTCNGNEDCIINCGSSGSNDGKWEGVTLKCPIDTYLCTINCNKNTNIFNKWWHRFNSNMWWRFKMCMVWC